MEIFFLVASILSYHYPSGLFRDTQRRYDRMRNYKKNFKYDLENGISPLDDKPIYKFPYALLSFLVGAVGPIFCLVEFDLNWFFAIIINVIIYFFVSPWIAFITIPHMRIYNKQSLKYLTIFFLVLGFAFYFLGILVN